jgi:hypothetical protein
VPTWRLGEHEHAIPLDELPGEESLVHRPERTDREVAIVDEVAADSVDAVQRGGERRVWDGTTLQPRMRRRIEEAAVVLGHTKHHVSAVDQPEERTEFRVQRITSGDLNGVQRAVVERPLEERASVRPWAEGRAPEKRGEVPEVVEVAFLQQPDESGVFPAPGISGRP